MKCTLSNILIFAAGAAIGSVATWRVLKTRYDARMKEELASIEGMFSSIYDLKDDKECTEEADEEPDVDYDEVVRDLGYSNSEEKGVVKPRVISPDEFGELEEYEIISLTYYADGILTDERDEPIEDVEGSVGRKSLRTFGEHEDDAVHVRNDRLHAYYEILFDPRNYYGDIEKDIPHPAEAE